MKLVNTTLLLKVAALLAVCLGAYYAFAAWAIWVVQCITGVTGNTFCMMLFLILLSHIVPPKYSGLPLIVLLISTLYIWTIL